MLMPECDRNVGAPVGARTRCNTETAPTCAPCTLYSHPACIHESDGPVRSISASRFDGNHLKSYTYSLLGICILTYLLRFEEKHTTLTRLNAWDP